MSQQCGYCGAPLRGRAVCAYCGSAAPPPEPAAAAGGAALCMCSVQAQSRCDFCDTPVCAQHADRYWRGSGGRSPLEDPAERKVWEWATTQPAELISGNGRGANPQTCTVCRSINAEQALARYRQTGMHNTDFERQVAAYSCGVYADLMPRAANIDQVGTPVIEYLRGRDWPHEPVALAVEWRRKRSGLAFRALDVDRGFVVPGVPVRNRAGDPEAVLILEGCKVWLLLGTPAIVSQPAEGGRMFFDPGQLQALAMRPDKRGAMDLAALLGVPPVHLDPFQPVSDSFWPFWRKVVVSLSGLSPIEHTGADGVARLAAADVVGGVVHPYYPPDV